MSKVVELFGKYTRQQQSKEYWQNIVEGQQCPFYGAKCYKIRKSEPEISIGTCTVRFGKKAQNVLICPKRLIEREQIFVDAIHLLGHHEPGNELHVLPETSIPGGSVDYFLVSTRDRQVVDFVGIELQTLDTTGTVWPERQRLLHELGLIEQPAPNNKSFGMNWKMTAKTILVQLHHKIETFEHINRHLVLVIQDCLLEYMKKEFSFDELKPAKLGDSMHVHSYKLNERADGIRLQLDSRLSTDSLGIAKCLGLRAQANVELSVIVKALESKISDATLLRIGGQAPA